MLGASRHQFARGAHFRLSVASRSPRSRLRCIPPISSHDGGVGRSSRSFADANNGSSRFRDWNGKSQVAAGAAAVVVLGGAVAARTLYGHLLVAPDDSSRDAAALGAPRRDASRATVLINAETIDARRVGESLPKLRTESSAAVEGREGADGNYDDGESDGSGEGKRTRSLHEVDAAEFAAFVKEQRALVAEAKKRSKAAAAEMLHSELTAALSDANDRVSSFADWYFSYPTTYKLLGIAMRSAAGHAVSFRTERTLQAAVSQDVQEYVRRKYEALVLRPAVTDPKVHRAFVRTLRSAHDEYVSTVSDELGGSLASFVSRESSSRAYHASRPPGPGDVVVEMDWCSQMHKVDHVPAAYERTPGRTLAFVGGGAAAGKVAGGAAAAGGAAKALAGKIAAPFASKAAGATLGKAAAGAGAAGGAIAGPAGAAAGAAIGLGVDVGVNAGVALSQRPALERDVRDSLDATVLEWEERLLPELERVVDIWFDHALDLLDAVGAECGGVDGQ